MMTMKFFNEVKEMRRLQITYWNSHNMKFRADMLRSQAKVDNMIKQIDAQRESKMPKLQPLPGWFQDDQST